MSKKYALIDAWGHMLIPLSLLEKIADQGYIASTEYQDGQNVISRLAVVDKFTLFDENDVKSVLAQQALQD